MRHLVPMEKRHTLVPSTLHSCDTSCEIRLDLFGVLSGNYENAEIAEESSRALTKILETLQRLATHVQ